MARTTNGLLMSMGTVNMWGFSPSIDLLPAAATKASAEPATEPLNLLLIGPGDIRHVLHTLAHRRRLANGDTKQLRPVRIYIYERAIESLARHLLMLQIAQDWELPLRQRCHLWLEIFGNARVQERTSAYIETKARALIELLHHERGLLAEQLDLLHLKMRTRDELVETFRSWFQTVHFDVDKLRDHRLRHYYDVRYDYRNNLIDWDYTMNLRKIEQASVIHIRQYREWRNSGIAFEFGDQSYTEPNRTMAAYTEAKKKHHGSVLCRGIWTDIIVGPYVSLGVQCDSKHKFAQQLFEIHNKGTGVEQNRHNTTEVAVFNLLSQLYELETGEAYRMAKAHDVYSGIGDAELDLSDNQEPDGGRFTEVADEDQQQDTSATVMRSAKETQAWQKAQTILESFEGVKIIPLTGKLEDLYNKKRYAQSFDHVFLSAQHAHVLQSKPEEAEPAIGFSSLLADNAVVSVESSVFLLPLTEDQRVLYMKTLTEMAAVQSLTPTFSFADGTQTPSKQDVADISNAVLQFQFSRCSSEASTGTS